MRNCDPSESGRFHQFLKYCVLNDVQTKLLIARNSRKSGLADVEVISGPSTGNKLSRHRRDVSVFLETLNVIREDSVDPSRIPARLRNALSLYTDLLDQHRYLDYSRIMVDAMASLYDNQDERSLDLQQTLGARVRYLFVDEYQDVNPLQESLIRRLHELGANICV